MLGCGPQRCRTHEENVASLMGLAQSANPYLLSHVWTFLVPPNMCGLLHHAAFRESPDRPTLSMSCKDNTTLGHAHMRLISDIFSTHIPRRFRLDRSVLLFIIAAICYPRRTAVSQAYNHHSVQIFTLHLRYFQT